MTSVQMNAQSVEYLQVSMNNMIQLVGNWRGVVDSFKKEHENFLKIRPCYTP